MNIITIRSKSIYMKSILPLIVIVSIVLLSSCAQPVKNGTQNICQPIVEKIPVKCRVPDVPKPNLETIHMSDPPDIKLEKLIHNYGQLEENNILLRQAIKVCQ